MNVKYGIEDIEFEVVKSKRKSISITIDEQGNVLIKTPLKISKKAISEIVYEKADWILKKQKEMKENFLSRRSKDFHNGEVFLFQGNEYKLLIEINPFLKKVEIEILDDKIIVKAPTRNISMIRNAIYKWYYEMAAKAIALSIEKYKKYIEGAGEKIKNIRIKDQKTRWGSCSSVGNLNFNFRLIFAPKEVLDYVVVHELSHLKHMNHSEEFWNSVEKILPDYKKMRQWLKNNGVKLFEMI